MEKAPLKKLDWVFHRKGYGNRSGAIRTQCKIALCSDSNRLNPIPSLNGLGAEVKKYRCSGMFPLRGSLLWWVVAGYERIGTEMAKTRGKNMSFEYYVIGAIALIVVVAGAAMLPDFVRYMKIRSM